MQRRNKKKERAFVPLTEMEVGESEEALVFVNDAVAEAKLRVRMMTLRWRSSRVLVKVAVATLNGAGDGCWGYDARRAMEMQL